MAAEERRESEKKNLNSHFEIITRVKERNLLFTNDFTSFSFEQTNIKICFYFSFIKGEMKEIYLSQIFLRYLPFCDEMNFHCCVSISVAKE